MKVDADLAGAVCVLALAGGVAAGVWWQKRKQTAPAGVQRAARVAQVAQLVHRASADADAAQSAVGRDMRGFVRRLAAAEHAAGRASFAVAEFGLGAGEVDLAPLRARLDSLTAAL
jgi:hypothetical protein